MFSWPFAQYENLTYRRRKKNAFFAILKRFPSQPYGSSRISYDPRRTSPTCRHAFPCFKVFSNTISIKTRKKGNVHCLVIPDRDSPEWVRYFSPTLAMYYGGVSGPSRPSEEVFCSSKGKLDQKYFCEVTTKLHGGSDESPASSF